MTARLKLQLKRFKSWHPKSPSCNPISNRQQLLPLAKFLLSHRTKNTRRRRMRQIKSKQRKWQDRVRLLRWCQLSWSEWRGSHSYHSLKVSTKPKKTMYFSENLWRRLPKPKFWLKKCHRQYKMSNEVFNCRWIKKCDSLLTIDSLNLAPSYCFCPLRVTRRIFVLSLSIAVLFEMQLLWLHCQWPCCSFRSTFRDDHANALFLTLTYY